MVRRLRRFAVWAAQRDAAVCLVAVLLIACGRESHAPSLSTTNAPVILVSVDTLRADRLPAYGYKAIHTPNFDAFRHDAILFTNAYSHVPLTLPSHVSMLTGLVPPQHGVRNNIGFTYNAVDHPAITRPLRESGYAAGAAVSAYVLRGTTGLSSIFDFYDDRVVVREGDAIGNLQRSGDETAAIALNWIADQGQRPFFFFLHLFEPHSPYDGGRYDAEILATDAILGRFFDALKKSGVYDRAIIVLTSDHGEGLGDHGEAEHGIFLYREAIHVPLMLKLPGAQRKGTTVDVPVGHADIAPTIAALTGVKSPVEGVTLLDVANRPPRRIFSETHYPRIHLGWSDLRSLADEEFHFIDAPRPELYAASDRAEKTNVVDDNRRVAAAMRKELEPFSRELPQAENIDPEEAKKLAALGYLSSTANPAGPLPDPKERIGDLNLLREAAKLDAERRYADAANVLRGVIERNPLLTDAWTMLGRVYEKSGRLQEAEQTYKRGIQVAPAIAGEFSLSLANVYLMMNKPDEASRHAEIALKTNSGSAHILMGRAALAKKDLRAAAEHAGAARQSFSYEPAALILLAQIQTQAGQLPQALETIRRASELAKTQGMPAPALLHFVTGDVLARMNRYPEAIAEFNEEIRLYPNDRHAYASLAVVYMLTGRPAEANATMERLVAANPGRSSYELAAKTFAELGDEGRAGAWRRRMPR